MSPQLVALGSQSVDGRLIGDDAAFTNSGARNDGLLCGSRCGRSGLSAVDDLVRVRCLPCDVARKEHEPPDESVTLSIEDWHALGSIVSGCNEDGTTGENETENGKRSQV